MNDWSSKGHSLCLIWLIGSGILILAHKLTESSRLDVRKKYLKDVSKYNASSVTCEAVTITSRGEKEFGTLIRYPLIDFLRGLALSFIVMFHGMWNFREFGLLPQPPSEPKLEKQCHFILYFALIFELILIIGSRISIYLLYLTYSPVVIYCLCNMWCESQVGGVRIVMFCLGMSAAASFSGGINWQKLRKRITILGSLAALISIGSYLSVAREWVYFGALHCITLVSLLIVPVTQYPITALPLFIFTQVYSITVGVFPLEVALKRPTLDYMPWFNNFGFCCLGVWFFQQGFHKTKFLRVPGSRAIHFEELVFGTFGRNALAIYMLHQVIFFPLVYALSRYYSLSE